MSEESSQSDFGELSRADFLSEFITRSIQRFVTEALEQEVADYLGRDYFQRRGQSAGGRSRNMGQEHFTGYRNGYEVSRLKTAEGAIPVEKPQIRESFEPFSSRLWQLPHLSSNNLNSSTHPPWQALQTIWMPHCSA